MGSNNLHPTVGLFIEWVNGIFMDFTRGDNVWTIETKPALVFRKNLQPYKPKAAVVACSC